MTFPDPVYLRHLEDLAFVSGARYEATVSDEVLIVVDTGAGPFKLRVDVVKSHLGNALGQHLVQVWGKERDKILLAPWVSRPMGRRLRASGVSYVDRAGNCSLEIAGRYVAQVEGRPMKAASTGGAGEGVTARGIRWAGYQVMFALLNSPELISEPIRKVAIEAGVSRQAVSDMFARLRQGGMAIRVGRSHRWVAGLRAKAMQQWLAGYESTLRPHLVYGRYRTLYETPDELAAVVAEGGESAAYLWGGSVAAQKLTGYYRGGQTTVHLRDRPTRAWLAGLRALPSEQGDLVLLGYPGPWPVAGGEIQSVAPLLVYSELMVTGGDRDREAAQEVYERCLVLP